MNLLDLHLDATRLMSAPSVKTKMEERFVKDLSSLFNVEGSKGSIILILGRSGTGKSHFADSVRKTAETGKIFGVQTDIKEILSVDLDSIGEPVYVEVSKRWTWLIDCNKLSDILDRSRGEGNLLILAGTSSNVNEIIDLLLLEGVLKQRTLFLIINSTSPEVFVEIKKKKKADMYLHHSSHADAVKDWVSKVKDLINKDSDFLQQHLVDYETEIRNKIRKAYYKIKSFNLQSKNANVFVLNNFNKVADKKMIKKGWH